MTLSFVTGIRVLLLEVRLSDVHSFTLLWVQLIVFMRKVVLLKMDTLTSLLPQFPDDKRVYAYLVSLLLFLPIHT